MEREQFISEVNRCQGALRRFLTALCGGNASLADDIAQDALLRAYVASGRFQGATKFRNWLFRIGYHCFINRIKSASSSLLSLESSDVVGICAPERADARFCYQELYRALQHLSEKERAVVLLHYFEDLLLKDIAIILEMPIGTVKYHLSVARNKLKNLLHHEG